MLLSSLIHPFLHRFFVFDASVGNCPSTDFTSVLLANDMIAKSWQTADFIFLHQCARTRADLDGILLHAKTHPAWREQGGRNFLITSDLDLEDEPLFVFPSDKKANAILARMYSTLSVAQSQSAPLGQVGNLDHIIYALAQIKLTTEGHTQVAVDTDGSLTLKIFSIFSQPSWKKFLVQAQVNTSSIPCTQSAPPVIVHSFIEDKDRRAALHVKADRHSWPSDEWISSDRSTLIPTLTANDIASFFVVFLGQGSEVMELLTHALELFARRKCKFLIFNFDQSTNAEIVVRKLWNQQFMSFLITDNSLVPLAGALSHKVAALPSMGTIVSGFVTDDSLAHLVRIYNQAADGTFDNFVSRFRQLSAL